MSELKASYSVSGNVAPQSLEAFANLPSSNSFYNWQPPEPEQIKALINLSGLNKRQWAGLLGVSYSEKHGSTTIRKWCSRKDAADHREIPFSTWRLMLIYCGVVDSKQDFVKAGNSNYTNGSN